MSESNASGGAVATGATLNGGYGAVGVTPPTNLTLIGASASGVLNLDSSTTVTVLDGGNATALAFSNGTIASDEVTSLLVTSLLGSAAGSNNVTSTKGTKGTKGTGDDVAANATPPTFVIEFGKNSTSEVVTNAGSLVSTFGNSTFAAANGVSDGSANTEDTFAALVAEALANGSGNASGLAAAGGLATSFSTVGFFSNASN